ncbi:MAG: hypothetical protein K2Q20_02400, partial [Phycisphaerales bacterium]|nr:hypothetical protein [Phycisphaerales bacterium]
LDSFWADSADGTKPAETNILEEIISYIEANHRAIAQRGGRVIQGFSMGGFGAMKFATKRPDRFVCVVAYDAAMVTWPSMQTMHAQQAAQVFGGSAAYYDQYSAWYWAGQNAGTVADDVGVRAIVGAILGSNRAFRDHLQGLAIPVDYVETGLPHALNPILDAQGQPSWAFIAAHVEPATCRADFSRNSVVDVADIFSFLNAWFASSPRADIGGTGGVGVDDIFAFLSLWFSGC